MSERTDETRVEMDRALDGLVPGYIFAAKKLRRFYDILTMEGLPEAVIIAELTAYCQGESRLQVDPMLHRIYAQHHQAMEEAKHADD